MISGDRLFSSFWMAGYESACHINQQGERLDMIAATQHDRYLDEATVKPVDGVEVDWQRKQLAVDPGPHPMLVRTPVGEATKVVEDIARVGVKDVRPVGMDQDPGTVVGVMRVASDMKALVDLPAVR